MRKFIHAITIIGGIVIILVTHACSKDDTPQLHQERLEIGRALLEVQAPGVAEILA